MIKIKVVEKTKEKEELTVDNVNFGEPFILNRDWIAFQSNDDDNDIDTELDGGSPCVYLRAQGSLLSKVVASKKLVVNLTNGHVTALDGNDCIILVDLDIKLTVIDD